MTHKSLISMGIDLKAPKSSNSQVAWDLNSWTFEKDFVHRRMFSIVVVLKFLVLKAMKFTCNCENVTSRFVNDTC